MDVKHIAKLANLPLTDEQLLQQEKNLTGVMDLVDHVQKLDTTGVEETAQVTGLVNATRNDVIDTGRILTQEQALANAPDSQDGFFKVKAIFDN